MYQYVIYSCLAKAACLRTFYCMYAHPQSAEVSRGKYLDLDSFTQCKGPSRPLSHRLAGDSKTNDSAIRTEGDTVVAGPTNTRFF